MNMIPEKRFLNQIQQVLARLMQPLWLLDTEGTVLLPEESRSKISLPEFMEPEPVPRPRRRAAVVEPSAGFSSFSFMVNPP